MDRQDGVNSRGGDTTAADTQRKRLMKKQKNDVLKRMKPLPKRITDLLLKLQKQQHQHQHHRWCVPAATDDPQLRSLAFIEAELSAIVASLDQMGSDYVGDVDFRAWLHRLMPVAREIGNYLDKAERAAVCGCHTQLHLTAASCFFRAAGARLPLPFPQAVKGLVDGLCQAAEEPCRYSHLLLADDPPSSRTSSSSDDAIDEGTRDHLLGTENARRNKLVKWFMGDRDKNPTFKVVSFVGPAGVGKTFLATGIYLHTQDGEICAKAMVKVSRRPDKKQLLRNILSQIEPAENPTLEEDEQDLPMLLDRIKHYLQHRRYLIIIDDIWEISQWEDIRDAFPPNSKGSRVMVTTSITEVARSCGLLADDHYIVSYVHQVKPLSEHESERLLYRRAFNSQDGCPPNLVHDCQQILMRCAGIPLFLSQMADWLKKRQEQPNVPHVPPSFEEELSSTYHDLPYILKLQLLYISMFPMGYMFEKKSFYRKLMAEWPMDSDINIDEYWSELIDRNIITRGANYKADQDEEGCHWQVNYFMVQFLASKSAKMDIVHTSGMLSSITEEAEEHQKKPRRLSLHLPYPQLGEQLRKMDLYQTRSLAISGEVDGIPLPKFIYLMVLDLEGWLSLEDEYLLVICKMYLLRYLSLKKTGVRKLPRKIKELSKLNSLNLSQTEITELPSEVFELPDLRMLDIRSTLITELPARIGMMRQLRDLFFGVSGLNLNLTVTEIPLEVIRRLDLLTTLETVDLRDRSASFVQALGVMWKLKVLVITWSIQQSRDQKFQQALCSSIKQWKSIMSLTIHCQLGCSMDFLLNDMKRSDQLPLKKFKVKGGRFLRIPKWFSLLKELCFIEITVCSLQNDDVSILGKLPSLESLVLGLHLLPNEAIQFDGFTFRKLQTLYIRCRVPWIIFDTGAMPKLTDLLLSIGGSPTTQANSVPSGISNLQSLKEISLHYNELYRDSPNVKETIEAVKTKVVQHDNVINLFINGNSI